MDIRFENMFFQSESVNKPLIKPIDRSPSEGYL